MAIRVASMGLAFALHIFLARVLGASEYGHYSYAAAWVALLQVIAAFGLPDATIRFTSAYCAESRWGLLRGFLRDSTTLLVITSSIVAATFACVIWLKQSQLGTTSTNVLYVAAISTPPVALAAVWAARLRGLKRIAESALPMDIIHPIVFAMFFVVAGTIFSDSPTGADAMLAHGLGALSAFLLAAYFFHRALPTGARSARIQRDRRSWLGVSTPLMAMSLLVMARARSTTLLVGLSMTSEQVGYFASANQVSLLTSFGAMAIAIWAAPFISEMHTKRDMPGLQRLMRLATRSGAVLMLPMAVAFIVFGREILSSFGNEFQAGYQALVILTLGQVVNAVTGPVGFLMIMTGNQSVATRVEIVCTALQVGLVVTLLPAWGIEGAAFGTAVATVVRNLLMFVFAWRITGIRSSIV
jgi:O-antigen/teichoic acid export membrane protein